MEKQSTRKFLKLFVALVALFLLGSSALLLAACKEEPEEPPHVHSYDNGTVTVEATCNTDGVMTFTCSCGDKYTQPIPATGDHKYVVVQTYPASCESDAYDLLECSVCGSQKQEVKEGTKTQHEYEIDPDSVKPATCISSGYREYKCKYCSDTYQDAQFTADNPKLGHAWKANTDADEKEFWGVVDAANKEFTVTTSTGEKLTYENLAEAKADGWTVSTEAMCSTDGTLSRVCDRCGETETVTIEAPGHKLDKTTAETNKWFVCKAQDNLTDVDGNKYAYICANGDHCDAKVTIDAEGTTAHYVAPLAHNYINEDGTEVEWTNNTATCTTAGKEQRNCVECGEPDYRDVAALGHDKNTVQMDGKTPVLICDEDPALDGGDVGLKALASVLMQKYNDDPAKYAEEYTKLSDAYTKYFVTDAAQHKRGPAYYCFRCHTFIEAMDHEFVYAALEEGKFDESDYQKDENGKPVEAEITEAEFTCQYVKVCKNCGTTDGKGDHGEATTATCRSGSYCTLCGEQRGGQLYHKYVNMSDILDTENEANSKVDGTNYTYGELRTAYEKVSATQAWMTPDAGQCDKPGKDVAVCVTCLLDAADGAEFDWAPKAVETEDEFDDAIEATNNQSVSAYTYEYDAKHDYVKAYFTTDAKAATDGYVSASQYAGRILWQNTNCLFGYKVAYICADCNDVYRNVPALNADASKNEEGDFGYTDSNGFILDTEDKTMTSITKMPDVDMHKADKHAAYVTDDYSKSNGYLASNCVETAVITYCCANCGQKIEAHYGDTTAPIETTTYEEGTAITKESNTTNFNGDPIVTQNTVADKDKKVNPENHKNDTFECDEHCNAYVLDEDGKKLYCSAFDTTSPAGSETTVEIADGDAKLTEAYHDTIIVDFGFSTLVTYDEGYTLKIATVTKDNVSSTANDDSEYEVDWANVKLSVSDKASECMKTGADSDNYTLPTKFTAITDYAGFTGGKYFVVVDAEGKIYPIEDYLYIFSHDDIKKTEGQVTGDVTVTQGDKFFIRFLDVAEEEAALPAVPVKAADAASLTEALKRVTADESTKTATVNFAENATVNFAENATVKLDDTNGAAVWEQLNKVKGDTIVFDLIGASIEWAFAGSLSFGNNFYGTDMVMTTGGTRTFKVMNGSIKFTAESGVENMAAFTFGVKDTLTGKIAFVAENMTVDTGAFGTAVEIGYSADNQPSVTLKNTVINAYGTYGIKIDAATGATDPTGENATYAKALTLQGTTVDMKTATGKDTVLSTALFVGAPVAVEVSMQSNLSATGQAVAVRAGSVVLTNANLTLKSGYTAPTVVNGEPEEGKNQVKFDTLGDTSITELDSWADGTTVQEYRMYGLWSTGNAIPQGVIVVGNSDKTNYQNKAVLDIRGGVNCVTEVDDTDKLVVGSYYGDNMAQTTGDDSTTKIPQVCVTLKIAQGFGDVAYCMNCRAGTVSLNGTAVTNFTNSAK